MFISSEHVISAEIKIPMSGQNLILSAGPASRV
jgi:hypothetical protein